MPVSPSASKIAVGVLLSGREKFSPRYGGAIARWNFEVYRRLASQVEATVFGVPTPRQDRYPLSHMTSGWSRVCGLVGSLPYARRYEESVWLWALRRHLQRLQILHVHNRPQWACLLRQGGFRGAIILHLHNDHLGHWSGSMLDDLASHLDAVVCCSDYMRNTFAGRSAALAAKAQVVFNGADTQLFHPREEVRETKTIFFVGRFHPEKGILQLVRAYGDVLKSHPDARLVIGGSSGFGTGNETSYMREVRALANAVEKNGARIEFTGHLDHERDLPLWFQKATIFACPSLFEEPFGLVNAEAMACATPVVGARRGGIPQVLGDTGCVIEPEDAGEFAQALSGLLSRPEECRRLGLAAYERCRRLFDWDMIAKQWQSLLQGTSASRQVQSKEPMLAQ